MKFDENEHIVRTFSKNALKVLRRTTAMHSNFRRMHASQCIRISDACMHRAMHSNFRRTHASRCIRVNFLTHACIRFIWRMYTLPMHSILPSHASRYIRFSPDACIAMHSIGISDACIPTQCIRVFNAYIAIRDSFDFSDAYMHLGIFDLFPTHASLCILSVFLTNPECILMHSIGIFDACISTKCIRFSNQCIAIRDAFEFFHIDRLKQSKFLTPAFRCTSVQFFVVDSLSTNTSRINRLIPCIAWCKQSDSIHFCNAWIALHSTPSPMHRMQFIIYFIRSPTHAIEISNLYK